jgi:hypothetical protein
MKFTKHDLLQIDEEYVNALTAAQSRQLTLDLLEQTKELMDRLNQNSSNTSIPPSKDAPWSKGNTEDDQEANDTNGDESPHNTDDSQKSEDSKPARNPGKQPGAPGFGRKVELPVTHTQDHCPSHCAVCNTTLDDNAPRVAITGLYVVDIKTAQDSLGISVIHTLHTYYELTCGCGHKTRTLPRRCDAEEGWSVKITEWHLCGPMLVSLIVCLSKRFHLSRRSIQEFLSDWLGIQLSKGVINKSILEAGRAVAPLEDALINDIKKAKLIHIDETSWKQLSAKLWLWVFATPTVCLFLIGPRTKEIAKKILDIFSGWLMSDGYSAYRHYQKRLRCWAHLDRKLKGLADSTDKIAQAFGKQGLGLFNMLKAAIYAARKGSHTDISADAADLLAQFKQLCVEHRQCDHEKTQALAREFLNDWETIWRVLSDVRLPLTNNEAERLLRHWVIGRQISFGTRSNEGSRSFALLASVIETCRLRGISPWPYLAEVIIARRKNNPVTPLPLVSIV